MPKEFRAIQITADNIQANLAIFRKHMELEEAVFTLSDPISSRRAHRYQRSTAEALFAYFQGLIPGVLARNPGYNFTRAYLIHVSEDDMYLASCFVYSITPVENVATPAKPNIFEIWSVLSNPNYVRSGAVAFMILSIYTMVPENIRHISKLKLTAWQQNFPFISFYDRVLLYAKYGFHNISISSGGNFYLCWDREQPLCGQQTRLDYVASLSSRDITFISQFNEMDFDRLQIILTRDLQGTIIDQNPLIPDPFRTDRMERNEYEGEEQFKQTFKMMYYSENDFWMTTDLLHTYNYERIRDDLQQKQNMPLHQISRVLPDHQFAFLHHSGLRLTPNRSHITTFVVPEDVEIVVINTPGFSTSRDIMKGSWDAMIRYFSKFSIEQLQQLFSNFRADGNGINVESLLNYLINTASGLVFQMNLTPCQNTYVQLHCYRPGDHCPNYNAGIYSFGDLPKIRVGDRTCVYDHALLLYGMYEINTDPNQYRNQLWRTPNIPAVGQIDPNIHPQFAMRHNTIVPPPPILEEFRCTNGYRLRPPPPPPPPAQPEAAVPSVDFWKNTILGNGFPNPETLLWPSTAEHYAEFSQTGLQSANWTFSYEITYNNVPAHPVVQRAGRKRFYILSCGDLENPLRFNLELASQNRAYSPVLFKVISMAQYYHTIQRVGEILHDMYNNYLPPVLTPASIGRGPDDRNIDQDVEVRLVNNPGVPQHLFEHYKYLMRRIITTGKEYIRQLYTNLRPRLRPMLNVDYNARLRTIFNRFYEHVFQNISPLVVQHINTRIVAIPNIPGITQDQIVAQMNAVDHEFIQQQQNAWPELAAQWAQFDPLEDIEQQLANNPGVPQPLFEHYKDLMRRIIRLGAEDIRQLYTNLRPRLPHILNVNYDAGIRTILNRFYEHVFQNISPLVVQHINTRIVAIPNIPGITQDQIVAQMNAVDHEFIQQQQNAWQALISQLLTQAVPQPVPQPGAPMFAAIPSTRKSKSAKSKPATRKSKSVKSKPSTRKSKSVKSKPRTRKSKSVKSKPRTRKSKSVKSKPSTRKTKSA